MWLGQFHKYQFIYEKKFQMFCRIYWICTKIIQNFEHLIVFIENRKKKIQTCSKSDSIYWNCTKIIQNFDKTYSVH